MPKRVNLGKNSFLHLQMKQLQKFKKKRYLYTCHLHSEQGNFLFSIVFVIIILDENVRPES